MNEPDVIRDMLRGREKSPRTLAVVGLSDNPAKPSHYVSAYMQAHGYRILPVNPAIAGARVLGETVWPSLADLPSGLMWSMFSACHAMFPPWWTR